MREPARVSLPADSFARSSADWFALRAALPLLALMHLSMPFSSGVVLADQADAFLEDEGGGGAARADSVRPRLFFLGIGTGDFEIPGLVSSLSFVDDDLRSMRDWARDQENKLFGEVVTETLEGREASRSGILAALSRFGRETPSGSPVGPEDLVVVYVAGHGVVDRVDGGYYYLTWDLKGTDVRNDALRYDELIARLLERGGDKRSVLVLMDTCQSGAVVDGIFQRTLVSPPLGDEQKRGWIGAPMGAAGDSVPGRSRPGPTATLPAIAARNGEREAARGTRLENEGLDALRRRVDQRQVWAVFSATSALQAALEGGRFRHPWEDPRIEGHGVFTWALLDALRTTHADLNRDGRVSLVELTSFVQEKVQEVGGQQPDLAGRQADRAVSYARGAEEECDGIDNDFDHIIDNGFADSDNDGVADCLSSEQCNGRDDNGNGIIDEGYDRDHDGHLEVQRCLRGVGTDCDDRDPAIHPAARDVADLVDNNCNGLIDEEDSRFRWDPAIPDLMEEHYRHRRARTVLTGASTLVLGLGSIGTLLALQDLPQTLGLDGSFEVGASELNQARVLRGSTLSMGVLSGLSFGMTLYFGSEQLRFRTNFYPPKGR